MTIFPEDHPVGYQWLIETYDLKTLPHWCRSYIISKGQNRVEEGKVFLYRQRYQPADETHPLEQLQFALKYEGVNLDIMHALFAQLSLSEVEGFVRARPTGGYARRIWFFYEWLTGRVLGLGDVKGGAYVDALDPAQYFTASAVRSPRHRVRDNLLGNRLFCPMVRRTEELEHLEEMDLARAARAVTEHYDPSLVSRAMHYLYAKETMSSYEIERERPSQARVARFTKLLAQSDRLVRIDESSLIDLQNQIVDQRFAARSYRDFQSYVGEQQDYDRQQLHYIAPKPEDVQELMDGLLMAQERMLQSDLSAVVAAAAVSFGFVYIHPFEDGNGRLHRFLIHYVLSKMGFTPKGMVFPVSAIMLRRMVQYDAVLESVSFPLLALLEDYDLDQDGRLIVRGETARHYRYLDYTDMALFLFKCIKRCVERDFPEELDYLVQFDRLRKMIREVVDLPEAKIDLLVRCLKQNNGRLSARKREGHFSMLTDQEIAQIEKVVRST